MVCRPKRDKKRDEYVEENDIDYETAGMTVNGVRWNYQIFSSQGEPTIDYGDVGDVAFTRICSGTEILRDGGRSIRKLIAMAGRSRSTRYSKEDGGRNSTGYKRKNPIVIICQHHDSSHNNNTLKEEQRSPESFMLRKAKGEPIHIDLSNDNHCKNIYFLCSLSAVNYSSILGTFSNPHVDEGRARKTIFIDLSLERDAHPRRVACEFELGGHVENDEFTEATNGATEGANGAVWEEA
ncbi:hypothetical protein CPB84DRAFT_1795511 [Gymnopilus junonius]|uniref:Uncharacterized protein n=1 Tax=Gymnopilus junonius TaxID=109634 RepID=A0A9P5THV1_GYMJU|nr:hypothetical protein CPB84DRAFT_1795511 [Gymnopilus junonius]